MKPEYVDPHHTPRPRDNYAPLMDALDRIESEQAYWLGNTLYAMFQPKSVIDWGCGTGIYLLPFQSRGATVLGIDGERTAGADLHPLDFECMDIRQAILTPPFDLALCVEVGEHLEPEFADVLVGNVANSANHVFWTAALPGQTGSFHQNEQPWDYWREKWIERGFVTDEREPELRRQIAESGKCLSWMVNNARLLKRG